MHCFKTRVYCCNCKPFHTRLQNVMDTIEDRQDKSDECPHETFKKAIFSSEHFMIKISASDGVDNGVVSGL